MQEFRWPYELTERAIATSARTGSAWDFEDMKAGKEHKLQIERSLILGERKVAVTSGNRRYTTRGLRSFVASANVYNPNGVMPEFDFDDWVMTLFINGSGKEVSQEKVLLSNNRLLMVVNRYPKVKLVTNQKDNKYGLSIKTYSTPMGDLKLVHHRLLDEAYPNTGYGLAFDPANVSLRYFGGNGIDGHTKLHKDIQANDATKRKNEYRTTVGLDVRHATTHGEIKNVTG